MRQVVSHYDMTDITPNDFSKLIQQLSDKGAISQKDTQELSSIRVDMENAGINSDDSVNLLQFYQERVAKAQSRRRSVAQFRGSKVQRRCLGRSVDLGAKVRRHGPARQCERSERGGVGLPDFPQIQRESRQYRIAGNSLGAVKNLDLPIAAIDMDPSSLGIDQQAHLGAVVEILLHFLR